MAQIGEISTVVTAKTAPFSKGMSRAKNEAKGFGKTAKTNIAGTLQKKVKPAFEKITGLLTSPGGLIASFIGGGMAIRQFTSRITETADKLDDIGKTASRLDMATDELMALEFAGQQTGVSFAELQKGLEKFNKRIGLAADGSGQAASMMEKLGINAEEFIKLPMSERLATIAGKIEDAGTAAERAAIADRMFGRAGASSLLNLLQEGDEGIKTLTETARTLGIVMDTHVVKAIEAANDTMNRFRQRSEGLFNQLTAELYPALGIVLEDLEKQMEKGTQPDKGIVRRFLDATGEIPYIGKFVPPGPYWRAQMSRARSRQEMGRAGEPLETYSEFRESRREREQQRRLPRQPRPEGTPRGGSEAFARAQQMRQQKAEKQRQAMIQEQRKMREAYLEQDRAQQMRQLVIGHF